MFAVYASPVADVIASHGVQYHQYADDTQLRLAMRADNTTPGLSVLAACTADVRQRYAERPAAQPGQNRSTDRRNGTPTCIGQDTRLSLIVRDHQLNPTSYARPPAGLQLTNYTSQSLCFVLLRIAYVLTSRQTTRCDINRVILSLSPTWICR